MPPQPCHLESGVAPVFDAGEVLTPTVEVRGAVLEDDVLGVVAGDAGIAILVEV
jgi:hypothetical protein